MFDISEWEHYYNLEGTELVRANLVYTPYVSPDKKIFCMSFNRATTYHPHVHENDLWTTELLTDRFNRELKFHELASTVLPTLNILHVDYEQRFIFLEWHGDDFLMQAHNVGGYDTLLPDWETQWTQLIEKMWSVGIYKISLHPNSWTVHNGILIPFNWFFCYDRDESPVTIRSLMIQISAGRQEKLEQVLISNGVDIHKLIDPVRLQTIAFNSFRHNYPTELIDNVLRLCK